MGAGDSKLVFKSHINQLLDEKVTADNHEFWSVIFTSPLQQVDVFHMISAPDVRKIREKFSENLATLIYKSVEQLHLYSQPQNFRSDATSARNSLYLLTRIMPFVFEHDDDGFVQSLFFGHGITGASAKSRTTDSLPSEKAVPEVIQQAESGKELKREEEEEQQPAEKEELKREEEEDVKESANTEEQVHVEAQDQQPETTEGTTSDDDDDIANPKKPLAELLLSTLMKIMFVPGFTIDTSVSDIEIEAEMSETEEETPNKVLLWEGGLVAPADPIASSIKEQIINRCDVLSCLIACLSLNLFLRPDEVTRVENKFLAIAVSKKMPFSATLFYSLLNTILNYDPTGVLPYTTMLRADPKEKLVELSIHTLCVLLQYKPEHYVPAVEHTQDQQKQQTRLNVNVYADYIAKLRQEDFAFLNKGLSTLIFNIIDANNTYLPGSQKAISFHNEMLILAWKLIEHNKSFALYLCRDADVTKIISPCLFVMQTTAGDPTQFPLFQVASFVVLMLSGNREFGVALNTKFDTSLPLQYPSFTGAYSDLLILVLHRLIAQDTGSLRSMYDCFLTIICNISPYTKTLSIVTCVKLVHLLEALSTPRFLYSSEQHPKHVHLLLETFNNLIQYQYEGNSHLVYSILRKKKIFEMLNSKPNLEQIRENINKRHKAALEKHQQQQQQQATTEQTQSPLVLPKPFLPTEEWVNSWKPQLPTHTILTMLKALVPEVERLCAEDIATEEDVITHLKKTTLVGLLPVPHTIVIRTFATNEQLDGFLLTYLWGQIYLKNYHLSMWDSDKLKLFSIALRT